MKIKKGDNVQILSGNDKGKTGEVIQTVPKENKVIVKGINIRKKHVKPKKQGEEGGIISVECSIQASNVGVVCSKCNKPVRIGTTTEKDKKVRVCKKCGNIIK